MNMDCLCQRKASKFAPHDARYSSIAFENASKSTFRKMPRQTPERFMFMCSFRSQARYPAGTKEAHTRCLEILTFRKSLAVRREGQAKLSKRACLCVFYFLNRGR